MATAINNISRRMLPSFAQSPDDGELLNSAWHSIEYASLVRSCVRASPEVVAVLFKSHKGEKERKRRIERDRVPSLEFPRGSPPRRAPLRLWRDLSRQWHGNSDMVQGQHATTKKRFSSCRTDAPWTSSFCAQFFSLSPSCRRYLSREWFFFSGLHNGVTCRHRDDDYDDDGESQLRENRALPRHAKCAMTFANGEFSKECFCFGREEFIDSSFPCWCVLQHSLRHSETNEVCCVTMTMS